MSAADVAVKLVVSDVDGTLVDKQKKVTPATIAAVERLRAAGIAFTIISARPMSGLLPIAATLGLDGDMAAFNGGIVFRRDGSISHHLTIAPDVARGVVVLAADAPVDTWVFAGDVWYATAPDGPHTASERIASNQQPVAVTDLGPLLERADKITFVSDDEEQLRQLAGRVGERFGAAATVMQSQTYYLDVTALDADKGAGLTALAAAYDVPLAEIAAIGDQANDLPMLARAGRAIAMGNAPDAVKAAAQDVTRGNDMDGVAHAIDTLILAGVV